MMGRLAIKIAAYPPDRRRRDLDNILKALLDSLTFAHVIEDDSQFDFISIARRDVIKDGAVQITITQLEQL
jgi:crossover junction endodeoxyribonuclease RusA